MRHLRPKRSKTKQRLTSIIDGERLRELIPDRRALIDIATSGVIILICLGILLRIREVVRRAKDLVTDGRTTFSPGQLVGDQAYFGVKIVFFSLVAIAVVAVLFRKRSQIATMTVVLAAVCFCTVSFVLATFVEYRGYFHF